MSATVHVIPERDLIEHELDSSCACGPTSEPVPDDAGIVVGFMVTHPSLDGREHLEHRRLIRALRRLQLHRRRWAVVVE